METAMIPQTYEELRHCIIDERGLELTPEYISERLSASQDDRDYSSRKFL